MFKLVLEKAEEPEIKLPTSAGSWKKQESSRKTSISALLTMPKLLTVWITINCGKFWKRWEYQTTWPASWETYMQVRKQVRTGHGTTDWFQIGKEYIKAVYCHPAYLTSMQSTSWETLDWKKHKLESRLPGEISITSDMQMTPPLWQKAKKNWRASLWKWKRRVESWLKTLHSENEDHSIWYHHFMANKWGNSRNSNRLYFLGLWNHCRWWLQP